jgi:tetratricopeptide (TPR) repeat protein
MTSGSSEIADRTAVFLICVAIGLAMAASPAGGVEPRQGPDPTERVVEAEQASRRGDTGGAAAHWKAVADQAAASDDPAQQWRALMERGQALRSLGHIHDAEADVRHAQSLAEVSGIPARVATCAIELAKIRLAAGDLVAAESQLVSASGAIAAHSHPELWAALSNERGNLAIAMAEPEEAIDHYTRAWQVASRVGDGSLAFRVAVNAAWLAAGNLDPAVAAEWIERARL